MHYFKYTRLSGAQATRNSFVVIAAAALSGFLVISVSHYSTESKPPNLGGTGLRPKIKDVRNQVTPEESDHPLILTRKAPVPTVTSLQGTVRGQVLESRAGRAYSAFYNIPYAKPPVNELRFKPPEPADSWSGLRDGTKIGPQCIQKEKNAPVLRATGEEDCLYLNVYTPREFSREAESSSYPVMVYVHGGEFNSGNGSRYGADYFMDEDVVLITFEFRLGPLGFLSTDDEEAPGNVGLKDVIMVLKWVQKYVTAYGGDPKRVTLFGNSSGATMVHSLMLSNMSKGLFHRAISESGTALLQGGALPFGRPFAVNLGIQMGCPQPNSSKELVECLRKADAADLVTAQGQFLLFLPVIETIPEKGNLSNVIFSKLPIDIVEDSENYPMKVPWIVGDNSAEELSTALKTLKEEETIKLLNTDWVGSITSIMQFRTKPSDEKLEEIKKFYFPLCLPVENRTRTGLVNMLSDQRWVHGTKTAAVAHAQHSPVYQYWLTKEPAKSYAEKYKSGFEPPFGVSHADELQYLFLYDGYPEIPLGSSYTRFSQLLVSNWAHFATHGKPEIQEWNAIVPADNGSVWFELGDECKNTRRLKHRLRFWDDFETELYR